MSKLVCGRLLETKKVLEFVFVFVCSSADFLVSVSVPLFVCPQMSVFALLL